MRKFILVAAVAALAACSGANEAPTPADTAAATLDTTVAAAEQGVAPGTYEVSTDEGRMGTTTINPDGSYVDTDADGKQVTGTYARRDGKDCFDPEGSEVAMCWTVNPTAADGSFTATTPDGDTTVTVTPQALPTGAPPIS